MTVSRHVSFPHTRDPCRRQNTKGMKTRRHCANHLGVTIPASHHARLCLVAGGKGCACPYPVPPVCGGDHFRLNTTAVCVMPCLSLAVCVMPCLSLAVCVMPCLSLPVCVMPCLSLPVLCAHTQPQWCTCTHPTPMVHVPTPSSSRRRSWKSYTKRLWPTRKAMRRWRQWCTWARSGLRMRLEG